MPRLQRPTAYMAQLKQWVTSTVANTNTYSQSFFPHITSHHMQKTDAGLSGLCI